MPTTQEPESAKRSLYDLKAIPSMYLLDRDKRVLAKDAFEVGISNGCSTGSRSDGRIGLFYRPISKSDRIFAERDPDNSYLCFANEITHTI